MELILIHKTKCKICNDNSFIRFKKQNTFGVILFNYVMELLCRDDNIIILLTERGFEKLCYTDHVLICFETECSVYSYFIIILMNTLNQGYTDLSMAFVFALVCEDTV